MDRLRVEGSLQVRSDLAHHGSPDRLVNHALFAEDFFDTFGGNDLMRRGE